jgi:uncharacterized protein YkwD/uncharacterized membrane protein required for colicin V production
MNLVDAFLILLVLLSILNGWRRGFIFGIIDLAGWIGSLVLGLLLYNPLAQFLTGFAGLSEVWAAPLAFLFIATVAGILIQIVGFALVRHLPRSIHTGVLNRLLGVGPGAINGLVAAAILASILLALPLGGSVASAVRDSGLANGLANQTAQVESALRPIFGGAIDRTLNLLTVKPEPESGETIDLHFTVNDPRPRPDLETQMLSLVNQARAKAGIGPLVADPELTAVARQHSADMFVRGYFSHATPDKLSPFDRMHNAGVGFQSAGENIALAPSLTMAHTGLMNSPGHRANILQTRFHRVGIGIMDGGRHGIMVTQDFRN